MDYKTTLQSQLLSKNNIDFLVNMVIQNFKISPKAVPKCINIITNNFNKYLDNLDRYPENNSELIDAINFLNKKCYDDFTIYLSTKYPNMNLYRNPYENMDPPISQIVNTNFVADNNSTKAVNQEKSDEIVILSEEDKNNLLKKFGLISDQKQTETTNFLSYLTNPIILQMFGMMVNQLNQTTQTTQTTQTNQTVANNQNTNTKTDNQIIIDEILDEKQLKELLDQKTIQNKTTKKVRFDENKPPNNDAAVDDKIKKLENGNNEDEINLDLNKLSKESLPLVEKKISQLVLKKNKYLAEKNMEMIKKLDEEKEKIISAVREYKKKLENEAKENENKINGMTISSSKRLEDGDNIDYLDLKFDPTHDYNDLKNIIIKFKSENKITDITLVDYYLPFNSFNVTRFNNKFIVYFNGRINRINIPPAKYEIETLLDYIKSQATFLDFSISENNIITIKNLMNIKFDLMIDNDTIFPLLGFKGKLDSYKEKIFYSGSHAYDITSNEKVFFTLSGSTMDPMQMEFDKEIIVNKSLKKSRNGVLIKQMVLNFTNIIGQCYDFTSPFKMCFKITYKESDSK